MAVVPVNVRGNRLEGEHGLIAALADPLLSGSVTIMIHGYRFCPFNNPSQSPHGHILSLNPARDCWKAISWPKHLQLGQPSNLGIALGWSALGSLSKAYARAERSGIALAKLVRLVAARRPDLRINVIAHSLGVRVALSAMPLLPANAISQVILMSGAEYREHARNMISTCAGRTARILNVRSRENLPFDVAFRALIRPRAWTDLPLSAGMGGTLSNWVDLGIDCPRHRSQLEKAGFRLSQPKTLYCHWSGYMRPGVFRIYRELLSDSGTALFGALRERLGPQSSLRSNSPGQSGPRFRATA